MGDFRGLIITALLVGLFTFALISFGVQMAVDNNVNSTILEDDAINKTFGQLRTNLSEQEGIAQTQREGFEQDNPIRVFDFLFTSIISAGKTFTSSLSIFYNVIFGLLTKTLGLGEGAGLVILGTIGTIILISVILLAWSVYKSGR